MKMDDERRAKDDAIGQLAHMTAKKSSAESLSVEMAVKLEDLNTQLEDERKVRNGTEQRLAEMAVKMTDMAMRIDGVNKQLEDEVRGRNSAEQRLAEMVMKIESEIRARNSTEEQLAEMGMKYEDQCKAFEEQLTAIALKLEDERKTNNEIKHQMTGKICQQDATHNCSVTGQKSAKIGSQLLHTKKRKIPSESDDGIFLTPSKSEQSAVKDFVDLHIVRHPGSFITTRSIYETFIAGCDPTNQLTVSNCTFQKILKSLILELFLDQPDVNYARVWRDGEHPRGYAGLALK